MRGSSVVDPGAVPGVSTNSIGYGDEIGSTRVVKTYFSLGIVPPLSGYITSANDNHEAFAVAA